MRILVVLLLALAICRAEDDSDEKFDSGEIISLTMKSVPSAVVHAQTLPLTLPVPKTTLKAASPIITPGTYTSVPVRVDHAQSLTPAVTKIEKPGIRFSIPVPQTQRVAFKIEEGFPVSVPASLAVPEAMPKTTLTAVSDIPTTKVTLRTATPAAAVPLPIVKSVPETVKTPAMPLQYLSSPIGIGAGLQAFTVPAQTIETVSHVAPVSTAVPVSAPFPATLPISYSTAPEITVPTFSMPVFQTVRKEPQVLTYWGDINTPQQMRSIMDLSPGGFSYTNFIGGASPVGYQLPLIQGIPTIQGQPLKATQFQTPQQVVPVKDVASTPTATTTKAQGTPAVIAA